MRFVNPLPFVVDMRASKAFYVDVLGLTVLEDHGNFVKFENGFAIHNGADLFKAVFGTDDSSVAPYGRANLVLYFEVSDLDAVFARIASEVDLIHKLRLEPWGQRVCRFYDPDKHIVELGEPP